MDAVTERVGAEAGSGAEIDLGIEGMTCASCARRVETALRKVPGVSEVDVDLATGHALVAGTARAEALVAALQGTGYDARPA